MLLRMRKPEVAPSNDRIAGEVTLREGLQQSLGKDINR